MDKTQLVAPVLGKYMMSKAEALSPMLPRQGLWKGGQEVGARFIISRYHQDIRGQSGWEATMAIKAKWPPVLSRSQTIPAGLKTHYTFAVCFIMRKLRARKQSRTLGTLGTNALLFLTRSLVILSVTEAQDSAQSALTPRLRRATWRQTPGPQEAF